jgi:hypothetical protein
MASDLVHFFKIHQKSWFKPISLRDSSFSSCEYEKNFFSIYTKNHYFRRVMALRRRDNRAILVDENIEDEVDLDIEMDNDHIIQKLINMELEDENDFGLSVLDINFSK